MRARIIIAVASCGLLTGQWNLAAAAPAKEKQKAATASPATEQGPLPAPVQATVTRRYPTAKVLGFEHHVEDTRHLFFVDLQLDQREVTMLASGRGQYLGLVQEDETDDSNDVFIELASAPEPVKTAIEKQFKKEPIDKLFMEVEMEKFIFCAEQTKGDISRWLSFSLQGELIEEETEVPLKDLPEPVQAGIKKAQPAAKLDSASLVKVSGPPASTHYSVDVLEGKNKLTLTVTPQGQVQTSEPADEDSSTSKP